MLQLNHFKGCMIKFLPGQYIDINFADGKAENNNTNYMSFSVSSPPQKNNSIEIVVIDFGTFRHRLYNAEIGTNLKIKGPFGKFIYNDNTKAPPVFIAGGTGIAPIMSMIQYIARGKALRDEEITLIYSCKTEKDVIFLKELTELSKNIDKFNCIFTITSTSANLPTSCKIVQNPQEKTPVWQTGHVDEIFIRKHVQDYLSKNYYICGPYEMMIMVSYTLQKLGVDNSMISSELW